MKYSVEMQDQFMKVVLEIKKARQNLSGFSAPQEGLEPSTYGLTVRRSNQLSY